VAVLAALGCGSVGRPTADPGPLQRTARAGQVLTFDGSMSKGSITKYTWDFGDGSAPVDQMTTTHAFAMDGDYGVTLSVRGPGGAHSVSVLVNVGTGCAATAKLTVATMNPMPNQPVVFESGGSTGCMGAALTTFEWEFGDGATVTGDASKATVSHTFTAANTYLVKLRVVDADGNEGRTSRSLGVGVGGGGNPVVVCPMAATAERGKPLSLTAAGTDPGGMALTYAWTFSDGATATGPSVQHTFAATGAATSSVVATTADSRSSSPCVTQITVTPPLDFTGTWGPLNPAAANLSGCPFSPAFPALTLSVLQTGDMLLVGPMGGPYPSGNELSGTREPPPEAANTFVVRKSLGLTSPGGGCPMQTTLHSVRLTFTSATTVTGTWNINYNGCSTVSCASCNCTATVMFSGTKQ